MGETLRIAIRHFTLVFACLELIVEHYPIVFPTDPAGFKELAAGFRQRQKEHMRVFLHALGALDGILLKIRQTSVSEIPQPTLYHCRKGFHVLNVQVLEYSDDEINREIFRTQA